MCLYKILYCILLNDNWLHSLLSNSHTFWITISRFLYSTPVIYKLIYDRVCFELTLPLISLHTSWKQKYSAPHVKTKIYRSWLLLMLTWICLKNIYQRDSDIFIRQSVLPPGIISEVQDPPISLDFTVHPLSTTPGQATQIFCSGRTVR